MVGLEMTGIETGEFRAYGGTVYASLNIEIGRPDLGIQLPTEPRAFQLDMARYPEIAQRVQELNGLITAAYLFEARVNQDPGQTYVPPAPPEEPPATP